MTGTNASPAEPAAGPFARAAVDLLSKGWSPVPLPERSKASPPKGWTGHDAPRPSRADVQTWLDEGRGSGNVAVRLPDTVLGLDVDAYGDKQGERTMRDALARLGELPLTYVSTSRNDGLSGIRFYRVPTAMRWASELGSGVEVIRHGHRYAVAAPSVHPNGRVSLARPAPPGLRRARLRRPAHPAAALG